MRSIPTSYTGHHETESEILVEVYCLVLSFIYINCIVCMHSKSVRCTVVL